MREAVVLSRVCDISCGPECGRELEYGPGCVSKAGVQKYSGRELEYDNPTTLLVSKLRGPVADGRKSDV